MIAARPLIAASMLVAALLWLGPGAAGAAEPPPLPVPKPLPPAAVLADNDRAVYKLAFAALETGHWARARRLARRAEDQTLAKVILWMHLLEPGARVDFQERLRFIERNPDWPRHDGLRARAEAAMDDDLSGAEVIAWFDRFPPMTGPGKVRRAEALIALARADEGVSVLREAWILGRFSTRDERAILRHHKSRLRPADHAARLDRLLWDRQRRAARRMLRLVDAAQRRLAEARLRLMAMSGGVDPAIARVPDELKDHPGLVYERLRWRRRKGFDDRAREILLDPAYDFDHGPRWSTERVILARRALDSGLVSEAYQLAREHGETRGIDFAEAEWLAGWIRLRFLREPTPALAHFHALYGGVTLPISLARAAYWAGRAAEAAGQSGLAKEWYARGAVHPTVYYGQLAAIRQRRGVEISLAPDPTPTVAERAAFEQKELVKVVRRLAAVRQQKRLRPFILRLVDLVEAPIDHALITRLARSSGRPDLAVAAAKRSFRVGVVLPLVSYPIDGFPSARTPERSLQLALARQESLFDPEAVSRSGALGLMQLMPATAKLVARRLKLPYSKARLIEDPRYNVRLGTAYLDDMLRTFGGSYPLAVAAYNAGPSRIKRWIKRYGDPRTGEVDPVDWIERIPFDETRNYVQRVLESLQIYRLRFNGATVKLKLDADLTR